MTVKGDEGRAVEFLTKPFDDEVLLGAIGRQSSAARTGTRPRVGDSRAQRPLRVTYPSRTRVMALVVSGLLNKQSDSSSQSARSPSRLIEGR